MNTKSLSHVLSNPEIKDFLSFYSSTERSEVLKLALLHTIYSLKSSFSAFPSIQELREIMSNAGKIKSLETTINEMKKKLESIKKEISNLEGSFNKQPEKKIESLKPELKSNQIVSVLKSPTLKTRSHSAPHISKAPSQWRLGDPSVFRQNYPEIKPANTRNYLFRDTSPPNFRGHNYKEFITAWAGPSDQNNSSIYPDWWLALTELDIKPQKLSQKITQSKPPKIERKQWPVEEEHAEEPRTIVPRQRPQTVKFDQKLDKAAEANFSSVESSGNDARVHFSDKKYAGWVGDFSKVVKGRVSVASKEISATESSRKDHSSGYTSSSMTNYVPSNEMRQFYQGEFNRFLESKNAESYASARMRSNGSLSSDEQKSSFYN